jgi:hypothetical protein
MVGDIDFQVIYATKNSKNNNFLSYLAIQKIDTYIAKQCSHVEFPNGFTLGPIAQATLVNMECTFRMTYNMVCAHTCVLIKTYIIYN